MDVRAGRELDFRILGPLEAFGADGRAIDLGGRQQRLVLAMLLVHRREVVSVDRLIDALWGEQPPPRASKNVQVHISRLRRALQDRSLEAADGPREGILRTRANGYSLNLERGQLDVDRFEGLVDDARRALAADDPENADAVLQEALGLWRGPALADFAYDSFAQGEIARLEELRLAALEERFDAALALGRHSDVTSDLQRLVAEHPLRERLRGQLMLALRHGGRKADALRLYDEARRLFAEELGIEPSETLRRLHSALLADDPALAPPAVRPSHPRAPSEAPSAAGRSRVLLGVGGALLLVAALAVAVLAITRDRTAAGLASVPPNSLARIDPETNRIVAEVPVGARPAGVVFEDGALWVANLDDKNVQRVDPNTSRVDRAIPTVSEPRGLVGGHGAVWAIGGEGIVRQIDPGFNEVTDRIATARPTLLGGVRMSGALAVTDDAVWAISGGAGSAPRLFRLDPQTRRAEPVVATGLGPTAIVSGFGDLWVTDAFENSVIRIDPLGVIETSIPVGDGASALAVDENAVWVVDSLDDAVIRIDPETNSVTTRIAVGHYPTAIVAGAGSIWVANRDGGSVSRIDPRANEVIAEISLGAAPAGLAFVAGSLWVTNQAGGGRQTVEVAGGLRVEVSGDFQTDPALYPEPQTNYATCAKLLNHPDASGAAGTRLVPEVAAALPAVSADGRTYTFTIRPGFGFSPPRREAVTAQTFKYSIERSLHPKMGVASAFVHDIVGQTAYESGRAAHIAGIEARGGTLSITLARPAPDFLARIAMPFFCAVPTGSPIDPDGVRKIPSAGPYYFAEHDPERRIVLKRNPNYGGSRPRRPDEIRFTIGIPPARALADVAAGRADYTLELPPDPGAEAELRARYGPGSPAASDGHQRYFVNPTLALGYLALNASRPLFADVRLRRAVNYAIDRRALARQGHPRLAGGDFPLIPTDQYLPPAMPGASREPLYPFGADLRTARRLAPDAKGTAVLYTCDLPHCLRQARVISSNLKPLGLDVDVEQFESLDLIERAVKRGARYDIIAAHWIADYADPSDFLNVLLDQDIKPTGNTNFSYYTDLGLARKLDVVARLSGPGRYRAYEALATEVARDAAPWVAYAVGTSREFFSARVGCQIFQPVYFSIDLATLCIRR
jgi:YVTN family beta-propeller protein